MKLSLIFPENHSLKEKRGLIRRIQARVSHQFNVSVTECGDQDLWQRAVLGFGVVGSSHQVVDATLQRLIDFVEGLKLAELGKTEVELFYC